MGMTASKPLSSHEVLERLIQQFSLENTQTIVYRAIPQPWMKADCCGISIRFPSTGKWIVIDLTSKEVLARKDGPLGGDVIFHKEIEQWSFQQTEAVVRKLLDTVYRK